MLGIVYARWVVDVSDKTCLSGLGHGFPYLFHDMVVIMRGCGNEILVTPSAQIVIGTNCTLVSKTLEIVLVTSVTSNSEVFCGGRIPFVWFGGSSIGYIRRGAMVVDLSVGWRFLFLREA